MISGFHGHDAVRLSEATYVEQCHGRGSSEALRLQIEVPSPSPWLLNPIYQSTTTVQDIYK